jgi:alanine-glyoxylate transaminase/serine-glyoxylate transaminase/serine-pyruvate transaminase
MTADAFPPPLAPPPRRLLGPGPSPVHPRVSAALALPLLGHLDPRFLEIMDATQAMLRRVFLTENRLTIPVSGTGSAGMEAALVNLIEPGDEVLVCVAGVFGGRMADIVERCGGVPRRLDRTWGEVFTADEVAAALARWPQAGLVALVHAETSTGAWQPLAEIGHLCRSRDRLFLVDAVTSLGGVELRVDDWAIDACYSGTQKCLSCPPGLAPLTFGPRALHRLERRRRKVASWYLDLTMIQGYWTHGSGQAKRAYHHTAPIAMNYALHEALALVLAEGLETRWRRHALHSSALMAGLAALGFAPFAQAGHRLPMLNAVRLPAGLDDAAARARLLESYTIEIGGGLGDLAGKVWRIGLMGHGSSRDNVVALLAAVEEVLFTAGLRPAMGAGLQAAAGVYSDV